jgi:hypothetical protein
VSFFELVSHIMLVSVQIVFASYKLTQNPLIGLLSYSVLHYPFQEKKREGGKKEEKREEKRRKGRKEERK